MPRVTKIVSKNIYKNNEKTLKEIYTHKWIELINQLEKNRNQLKKI